MRRIWWKKIICLPSLGKSDHVVLSFNFKCLIKKRCYHHKKYNFNKGDYEPCVNFLSATDWSVQDLNLEKSWNFFSELIVDVTEKFGLVSKVPIFALKPKPYLTQKCKDAIKIKHGKLKKFKYCKTEENYSAYKTKRNKMVFELRNSKYYYDKDLAARIKMKLSSFGAMFEPKPKLNGH